MFSPLFAHKYSNRMGANWVSISKYPPAEPEALRLLAPRRGLIATGEKQKQKQLQQLQRC